MSVCVRVGGGAGHAVLVTLMTDDEWTVLRRQMHYKHNSNCLCSFSSERVCHGSLTAGGWTTLLTGVGLFIC